MNMYMILFSSFGAEGVDESIWLPNSWLEHCIGILCFLDVLDLWLLPYFFNYALRRCALFNNNSYGVFY